MLNINNIDISRITVSKAKDVSKDGMTYGKRVYLNYNDPKHGTIPLTLSLPKLKNRFGLSRWDSENGQAKYMLNAHFEDFQSEVSTDGKKCYEQFCKMEEHIKKLMAEHSLDFFNVKKPYTLDLIDQMELLYPVVKRSANKETGQEYPPSIKMNFPRYPNKQGVPEFTTKLFLKKGQPVAIDAENPANTIPPYSESKTMVYCSLFISKSTKKVSLTLNTGMVKVYPAEQATVVYNNDWDSESETEAEPTPQNAVAESDPESDSGSEDSSESEPDSEPEPEPTPKKRQARKVKLPA